MPLERRIGPGAGPQGLNLEVIDIENRSDYNAASMTPTTPVWKLKDLFTTVDGLWDPLPPDHADAIYATPAWARAAYLKPWGDPLYNDDGGAATHILVCSINGAGAPYPGAGFAFTSDGARYLQPPTAINVTVMTAKAHGWANLPMSKPGSTFFPPAHGPWSFTKLGISDIVVGSGLPGNHHITTCGVWVSTTWGEVSTPVWTDLDSALRTLSAQKQVIQFNPAAALQKAIFAAGFVPNSPEFSFSLANGTKYIGQRAENLGTGEVRAYACKVDDWGNVFYRTQ